MAGSIRSGCVIEILAILKWLTQTKAETAQINPGEPWQSGTNESFDGRLRDGCLCVEWFRTRREARVEINAWRQHCSAVRPHMSLNYLTPIAPRLQHQPLSTIPNRAALQE